MGGTLGAAAGWVLLAALVTSIGATGTRWLIVPRVREAAGGDRSFLEHAVGRLASYGAAALVLGMLLFFVRQLAEFRDPFAPLAEDAALLLSTEWGRVWMWGFVGSVAATGSLILAGKGGHWGWWIATPILLCLSAFPAFTGHAAGEEELRSIALASDALHVLAASCWMGGLASVLYLELRWRRSEEKPGSLLADVVPAFSPVAIVCVAVLVATGVFASWLHVESLSHLFTTGYGRILVLKLVVVGAVLGLGALNWRRLSPSLGESEGDAALRRAAAVELLLGHVALFVTAVLIRTSPMAM